MKALILAAGYATRLYPLTKEYPKPLLKVGRKFLIDYIVDKLKVLDGCDEIIVVTNTKFISFFRQWKKKLKIAKPVTLVDDLTKGLSDRRGAIGDTYFAIKKKRIKDNLLIIGGDNLFDSGLDGFLKFSAAKSNAPVIGVYDIKERRKADKYGVIRMDRQKRIVDFQEKPARPKSSLIAMCLYYFPKNKVKLIGEYMRKTKKHDATGFYIDWLRKKEPVYGFVFGGRWYDIGDPKVYNEAKQKFN